MAEQDRREKWALVLGASSGFGAATAIALARDGYGIIGVHLDMRSSLAAVDEVRRTIEAAEVVAYLRDLARLWDDAPLSRRALARLSSSGSRSWDCAGCGSSRRRQRSPRAS